MRQPWFRVKRYGYGAGLPIAWQGWTLVSGFAVAVAAGSWLLAPRHAAVWMGAVVLLAAALVWVSARHSDRPWRWRWGGEE